MMSFKGLFDNLIGIILEVLYWLMIVAFIYLLTQLIWLLAK